MWELEVCHYFDTTSIDIDEYVQSLLTGDLVG